MNKLFKILLVASMALAGLFAIGAAAQAGGPSGNNEAQGDISSETNQSGTSSTGDAVGGQVVGVVSAGDASVDATNRSEDVDIETGDATADNQAEGFTGQRNASRNEAQDDISSEVSQEAVASTGDGVGGSVIGVLTSAGGSADIVAANTSTDVDISTGDADAVNALEYFVGQELDVNEAQDAISLEADQVATAASGDGVAGQVLGIVSAGEASVDATNESTDVDVETGDAVADNLLETFVGQDNGGNNEAQDDISSEVSQEAVASTGDGVGGSVIGVLTSAGGSADVVAANTSTDVDISTGDADAANALEAFVGQQVEVNEAQDAISLEADQVATAASGDGVGGQVLGIVSAGDASVDATNESTDVDVTTGDATADNQYEGFIGQLDDGNEAQGNIQSDVSQEASANSGDAVAGQVAGVVTSAGGSADLVLANTSEDVDSSTGDSEFNNQFEEFVGQET